MDNFTPTYQTTSFKKEDGGAIVYIALAGLGAIVILLGALYFMFFNNGNNQGKGRIQSNKNVGFQEQSGQLVQPITSTVTPTISVTPPPTATTTPSVTPSEPSEGANVKYDTNYVFGAFETVEYKLNGDKTQIIKTSTGEVVYTAPSGYFVVSFAVNKPSIFVVLKTPEAYTYEFRKVPYGSNSLGGLFYKYYSAYSMVSFVVNPKDYKTNDTYIILDSLPRKQFLVLDIRDFKEVGKRVVNAPSLAEFKAAYKLADQNAIRIEYAKSSGDTGTLLVSFED